MSQNREVATSLIKALDVMSVMGARREGASVVELAKLTGLPRTTVRRIVQSLVAYGLAERHEALFRFGPAFDAWSRPDPYLAIRQRYRPILKAIAERAGELVLLGVPEGRAIVHIDYIEADHAVRVAPAPVTRHDLDKSAQGKLILSRRPDWARQFRSPRLLTELEEIKRTGIAWNRQESDPGVIAAAISGMSEAFTDPVIAIAWPVQRFNEPAAMSIIHQARQIIAQARREAPAPA